VVELKPCPFCGGEAKVMCLTIGQPSDEDRVWAVWCVDDLHAEYSHGHYIDNYGTRCEAVSAWNRRIDRQVDVCSDS